MNGTEQSKEKEKKNKTKEEQKKEIAASYGIDLSDIEHVKLESGIEVFKLFNPKDGKVKLISLSNEKDAKSMFESSQKDLSFAQTNDSKENVSNIFDYNMKYKNSELSLVSMSEFKSNKFKYKRVIRTLKTEIRCKVKALLKGAKKGNLKLSYINFENGIAIDENGTLIDVSYNYMTNSAVVKQGQVLNNNKSFDIDTDIDDITLSEDELGNLLQCVTLTEDGLRLVSEKELNINGEIINTKSLVDMYNMPEMVDKLDLTSKQRKLFDTIASSVKKQSDGMSKGNNTKQKQFVKSNNHNISDDKAA